MGEADRARRAADFKRNHSQVNIDEIRAAKERSYKKYNNIHSSQMIEPIRQSRRGSNAIDVDDAYNVGEAAGDGNLLGRVRKSS